MRNTITRLMLVIVIAVAVVASIPVSAAASTSPVPISGTTDDPPLPSPPVDPPHKPSTYTVQSYVVKSTTTLDDGKDQTILERKIESLDQIASKLNLTSDEIKYSNPGKDLSNLNEGDILTVPPIHGIVYSVQEGDTLSWIAYSYQIDITSVINYNSIADPDSLTVGQIMILPSAKLPPIPKPVLIPTPINQYTQAPGIMPSAPVPYSGGNRFAFGYCTWYVANRRPVPWLGNAIEWWPNARAFGYSEGRTPVAGSILVENLSSFGHVAYVESVGPTSFVISEMNYSAWDVIDSRTVSISDPAIIGFIY